MLIVAIIIALVLVYLLNFRQSTQPVKPKFAQRRVGGVYAYHDMFDLAQDDLPVNTVTGPGGGSFVKKYV